MALPAIPPTTAPTAAPTRVPTGPAAVPTAAPVAAAVATPAATPPTAAPTPTPTGCAPGALVIGSRFAGSAGLGFFSSFKTVSLMSPFVGQGFRQYSPMVTSEFARVPASSLQYSRHQVGRIRRSRRVVAVVPLLARRRRPDADKVEPATG